jgi:hypothetical protein
MLARQSKMDPSQQAWRRWRRARTVEIIPWQDRSTGSVARMGWKPMPRLSCGHGLEARATRP